MGWEAQLAPRIGNPLVAQKWQLSVSTRYLRVKLANLKLLFHLDHSQMEVVLLVNLKRPRIPDRSGGKT